MDYTSIKHPILAKNKTKLSFLNSVIIVIGQPEGNFASGFATFEQNIVYRNINSFLILAVQYLDGLHNYLHPRAGAPVAAIGSITAAIVRDADADTVAVAADRNP